MPTNKSKTPKMTGKKVDNYSKHEITKIIYLFNSCKFLMLKNC